MKFAWAALLLSVALIVFDACRPAKKVLRRPRESHRVLHAPKRMELPPPRRG